MDGFHGVTNDYNSTGGSESEFEEADTGNELNNNNVENADGEDSDNELSKSFKFYDGEKLISAKNSFESFDILNNRLQRQERYFWAQRYADKRRTKASAKDKSTSSLVSSNFHEFFKSYVQNNSTCSASPKLRASKKPGPFHCCPSLHLNHDQNYVSTTTSSSAKTINNNCPSIEEPLFDNNDDNNGSMDYKKSEARYINLMKGLPAHIGSGRQPKPACKVCSQFGSTLLQIRECPDLLYDSYKRNCTYRHILRKQEEPDPTKSPAQSIINFFETTKEPTLDQIAHVLIPHQVSSTTPSNWMESLYKLLDPSYSSPNLNINRKKSKVSSSSAAAATRKTKSNQNLSRRTYSRIRASRKLKKKSSSRLKLKSIKSSVSLIKHHHHHHGAGLSKLARRNSSKSLIHVKSRYLDHFDSNKKKKVDQIDGDDGQMLSFSSSSMTRIGDQPKIVIGRPILGIGGDGINNPLLESSSRTKLLNKIDWTLNKVMKSKGGEGDTKASDKVEAQESSILRLSRPTTATSIKSSNNTPRLRNKSQKSKSFAKKKSCKKNLVGKGFREKKSGIRKKSTTTFTNTKRARKVKKPKATNVAEVPKFKVKSSSTTKSSGGQNVPEIRSFYYNHRRSRNPAASINASTTIVQACGFEFNDQEGKKAKSKQYENSVRYQCLLPTKKKIAGSRQQRRTKPKKSDSSLREIVPVVSNDLNSVTEKEKKKHESELEKYKQTIFKMLEKGNLMGTSLHSVNSVSASSPGRNSQGKPPDNKTPRSKQPPSPTSATSTTSTWTTTVKSQYNFINIRSRPTLTKKGSELLVSNSKNKSDTATDGISNNNANEVKKSSIPPPVANIINEKLASSLLPANENKNERSMSSSLIPLIRQPSPSSSRLIRPSSKVPLRQLKLELQVPSSNFKATTIPIPVRTTPTIDDSILNNVYNNNNESFAGKNSSSVSYPRKQSSGSSSTSTNSSTSSRPKSSIIPIFPKTLEMDSLNMIISSKTVIPNGSLTSRVHHAHAHAHHDRNSSSKKMNFHHPTTPKFYGFPNHHFDVLKKH